jgi:DNA-binding beta-propeller fold protein YncE
MKTSSLVCLAAGLCLAGLGVYLVAAPAGSGYHLIKKVSFGAAPGDTEYFDYITVDSAARRVYLSHGTEIKVMDADKFTEVGTITAGFKRNHGVALVPELNKGFISDGELAEAVMFDMKTLKVLSHIKTEKDCDSIFYEPASKRIFTFNGGSKNSTVIDPAKGAVISTIDLGGAPEFAVVDGKGMIYDTLQNTNEVIAIDARAMTVKSRWPVAPAGAPTSIAMDRKNRRLFVGGRNPKLLVMMDADSGKIIGPSFPIGDRVDAHVFDSETGMLAASTREGTIHVFHLDSPDKLSVVETVKTEFGAKTMGLDPKTHNLYVDTSDFDPAPPPTEKQRNPQPVAKPGTFRLLVYGR